MCISSGKVVVVDNEGVLVIDNVKVYSLRDGPVHHNESTAGRYPPCNVAETQSKLDAKVDHLSYAVQELRQCASSDCVSYKKTEPGDSFITESLTAVKQKLDELSRTVQNLRCNASGDG